jgi:orotidine-5'-phosphate decarboxylase
VAEIIVALDVPSSREAWALVDRLPGLRWVKVGPMLLLRSGEGLIAGLKDRGLQVFLDLKWHDIPNSVAEAVRAASGMGVDLATVHSLGGDAMLRSAVAVAGQMRLAAVSVLTSHDEIDYWSAVGRPAGGALLAEVRRLAALAVAAGVHAVVASPHEVGAVREVAGPERWIVTPGIRPAGAALDDQRRAADPATAAAAGATHLVVGRPITRAERPEAVYEAMREAAG